jgi:hypothetical protein
MTVCLFRKQIFCILKIGEVVSCEAKVVLKDNYLREATKGVWLIGQAPIIPGNELSFKISGHVTFEFENRQSVTLTVPRKVYKALNIGSIGILHYRKKDFIKFDV